MQEFESWRVKDLEARNKREKDWCPALSTFTSEILWHVNLCYFIYALHLFAHFSSSFLFENE